MLYQQNIYINSISLIILNKYKICLYTKHQNINRHNYFFVKLEQSHNYTIIIYCR